MWSLVCQDTQLMDNGGKIRKDFDRQFFNQHVFGQSSLK